MNKINEIALSVLESPSGTKDFTEEKLARIVEHMNNFLYSLEKTTRLSPGDGIKLLEINKQVNMIMDKCNKIAAGEL